MMKIALLIIIGSFYLSEALFVNPNRFPWNQNGVVFAPPRWPQSSWMPPNHWSHHQQSWNVFNPRPWNSWPFRRSSESEIKQLECVYTESKNWLSCQSDAGKVECDVLGSFGKDKPTLFKIASQRLTTEMANEVKYSLYPQKSDKSGWLDTKVTIPDSTKISSYSLEQSTSSTDLGFKFLKPVCWNAFLSLLQDSSLKVDTIQVFKEAGKTDEVKVVGQISFVL